jgi:hypothetical protein
LTIACCSALAACGGGGGNGGSGESGDISASINAVIKHHDCSRVAPSFRQTYTGFSDVSKCSHALSLRNAAGNTSITNISVNGDRATAQVTVSGQTGTVDLVRQGDQWLISDLHR